jgi:hypothetical protein
VFLIGTELQKQINSCEFIEQVQVVYFPFLISENVLGEDQEENEEGEQENLENLDETKQKIEIDYFDQIKDFALVDTQLVIKYLCGWESQGINRVNMYDEIK